MKLQIYLHAAYVNRGSAFFLDALNQIKRGFFAGQMPTLAACSNRPRPGARVIFPGKLVPTLDNRDRLKQAAR
jgi:hypothetical protein